MKRIKIAILGAGGFAREVLWALRDARAHASGARFEPVAFVDRVRRTDLFKGLPVVTLDDVRPDTFLICGIGGMTEIKERVVNDALARGHRFAPAVIAEGARVGPDIVIGDGTIICAGSIATCDITIGAHVAVNLDCTIGHDAEVGDFTTISPGVHVSGNVNIGHAVYLGTASSILEGLQLGERSILGAGAVATRDVPRHALAVGVPAVVKKAVREFACALPAATAPEFSPAR
ncbi:MAG: acetyltransferase [Planctomycetes bacterium]|nr:acetyltransferase [Planctomycetota bacterium]